MASEHVSWQVSNAAVTSRRQGGVLAAAWSRRPWMSREVVWCFELLQVPVPEPEQALQSCRLMLLFDE